VSTVKTDAITAVSTNADLSLDGLGTGGVSIASTLKMTKGGDISSASPLVIDVDGNYFDVTGTTNFSAMTVESGNFFMLQFDGALTITHGSGIELPGAANLTTATGDRLICYATAANTVEVMSVETEAAAGSSAMTLIGTDAAGGGSGQATLDVTGLSTTYASYLFVGSNVLPITDDVEMYIRLGDSSGIDSGSSDYAWQAADAQSTGFIGISDEADTKFNLTTQTSEQVGSGATEGASFSGILTIDPTGPLPTIVGIGHYTDVNSNNASLLFGGNMLNAVVVDRIQFLFESGNVETGRLTVWGLAHA